MSFSPQITQINKLKYKATGYTENQLKNLCNLW